MQPICLPSLEENIAFPEVLPQAKEIGIVADIGIYDDPDNQLQEPYTINLTNDNVMIIGSAQTGKTNLLQTIIRSITTKYTPEEVSIYIIDFASMFLKTYEKLAHVGGVVTPPEDEKLKNLFKLIQREMVSRREQLLSCGVSSYASYLEAGMHGIPQIVLMIDNLTALKELYFEDDDELLAICREGQSLGINVIIANSVTTGIGYKYLSNFSSRISLFNNDSSEYSSLFDHCYEKIDDIHGRSLVEIEKQHFECQTYMASTLRIAVTFFAPPTCSLMNGENIVSKVSGFDFILCDKEFQKTAYDFKCYFEHLNNAFKQYNIFIKNISENAIASGELHDALIAFNLYVEKLCSISEGIGPVFNKVTNNFIDKVDRADDYLYEKGLTDYRDFSDQELERIYHCFEDPWPKFMHGIMRKIVGFFNTVANFLHISVIQKGILESQDLLFMYNKTAKSKINQIFTNARKLDKMYGSTSTSAGQSECFGYICKVLIDINEITNKMAELIDPKNRLFFVDRIHLGLGAIYAQLEIDFRNALEMSDKVEQPTTEEIAAFSALPWPELFFLPFSDVTSPFLSKISEWDYVGMIGFNLFEMDDEAIEKYFQSMISDIVSEFTLMSELRGNSYIVSYEDHEVVKHPGEFIWDIFIRMELLVPLTKQLKTGKFTLNNLIKLGTDICRALEACQSKNIIHRDIKPENIFCSKTGNYKLGDFGIAREIEEASAMSKKGTPPYMAPEVYKGLPYDSTADIYSLGIVLYRFLNNNRLPLTPPYPEPLGYRDRDAAIKRRLTGEELPPPCNASDELSRIVLKACAYKPEDRYQSAEEFRKALETIVDPDDSELIPHHENGENTTKNESYADEHTISNPKTKSKHKKILIVFCVLGILLLILGSVALYCSDLYLEFYKPNYNIAEISEEDAARGFNGSWGYDEEDTKRLIYDDVTVYIPSNWRRYYLDLSKYGKDLDGRHSEICDDSGNRLVWLDIEFLGFFNSIDELVVSDRGRNLYLIGEKIDYPGADEALWTGLFPNQDGETLMGLCLIVDGKCYFILGGGVGENFSVTNYTKMLNSVKIKNGDSHGNKKQRMACDNTLIAYVPADWEIKQIRKVGQYDGYNASSPDNSQFLKIESWGEYDSLDSFQKKLEEKGFDISGEEVEINETKAIRTVDYVSNKGNYIISVYFLYNGKGYRIAGGGAPEIIDKDAIEAMIMATEISNL